jgi:hypothetical protein
MQLTLDVEELADCGRVASLRAAPSAFTFFVETENKSRYGMVRTYNVATVDACSGIWGADIQRPPVAQNLGVPCDDCVAFERIFTPLKCPAVPAECSDTFYGRLTRSP